MPKAPYGGRSGILRKSPRCWPRLRGDLTSDVQNCAGSGANQGPIEAISVPASWPNIESKTMLTEKTIQQHGRILNQTRKCHALATSLYWRSQCDNGCVFVSEPVA